MGWQPSYQSEAQIYAKYLLKEKPDAKIAMLYQNDDFGKDYLKGLKDGLGAKAASMIVAEESYEVSRADHRHPHRQAEGHRRRRLRSTSRRRNSRRRPSRRWPRSAGSRCRSSPTSRRRSARDEAGRLRERARHPLGAYVKDAADAQWKDDPGMKKLRAFLDKYYPDADRTDSSGGLRLWRRRRPWSVLKMCGDDLTRANVMKQAASLKDFDARHAAAGHQDQHLGHRLRADRAAADDAVQGREVGAVRRHHQRRRRQAEAPLASSCPTAPTK